MYNVQEKFEHLCARSKVEPPLIVWLGEDEGCIGFSTISCSAGIIQVGLSKLFDVVPPPILPCGAVVKTCSFPV